MEFDAMRDYLLSFDRAPELAVASDQTLTRTELDWAQIYSIRGSALSVNDLLALRGIFSRKPTDEPQEDDE